MTAHALMEHEPEADEATIVEWLRSNLCRCTGYEEIVQAVKAALKQTQRR